MKQFIQLICIAAFSISAVYGNTIQADQNPVERPFITVWQTDNEGISEDNQITIPGVGTDYLIEWVQVEKVNGHWEEVPDPDTGSEIATNAHTLTFNQSGKYRISISGDFHRINFWAEGDHKKLLEVEQWGDIRWSTMASAFRRASNLVITAEDAPDLTNVESMAMMFSEASSFNQDISHWDVGNVMNLSLMFSGASSFNQNIGGWDVGNVTNIDAMFEEASSFNQDIGSWDVRNVTQMSGLFRRASSFNQDIGEWNTSKVNNMMNVFAHATSFNQDISGWDVSNVSNMTQMFSLARAFNQDLNEWDVSNVTNMSSMFMYATNFNQNLGSWDVGNVTNMIQMLDHTPLSVENYDSTLIGWSELLLQNDVTLGALGLKYHRAEQARQFIIDEFGWTIRNDEFTPFLLENPLLISPEDQAKSLETTVIFLWEPVERANGYEFQLATDEDFEHLLDMGGNETQQENLAKQRNDPENILAQSWTISRKVDILDYSTEYFWRVKAFNEEEISDWSEVRSLTTDDAPITTPVVLYSPSNHSSDVPFPVELAWETFDGAAHYDIQLSKFPEFKSYIGEIDFTGTSFMPSDLSDETQYYWRVRATVNEKKSVWSEVWQFKTGTAVPEITGSPVLLFPENESEEVSIPVILSWQEFENADHYQIELSLYPSFDTTLTVHSFDGTQIELGNTTDASKYYWRVRAAVDDQQSAWSDTWSFETELRVPEIPVWEPGNEEENVETTPKLVWGPSDRAETYHLQLSDMSDFRETEFDIESIEDTEYQVTTELDKGVTYYWRIRAENESGYSGWSEPLSFTTVQPTSTKHDEVPTAFELFQNFPNPFNPATQIRFAIPEQVHVHLAVYNMLGREIATLVDETRSPGLYDVTFDGRGLSSGVIIYRLKAGSYRESRHMMFVK